MTDGLGGTGIIVHELTTMEIAKIGISATILVIAVLILTYAGYKWANARYRRWLQQKEIEEKIAAGIHINPAEYPEISSGVSKGLFYIFGALALAAGVVFMLL